MASEKEKSKNQALMFITVGIMFSALGSSYFAIESMPALASLAVSVGAILSFVAGAIKYREADTTDSGLPE
jgi:hypothetical protein